jgi:hypothetical protein
VPFDEDDEELPPEPLPARRFIGFDFDTGVGDGGFLEIGAIWIGMRTPIAFDRRFRSQSASISEDVVLTTGRRYVDPRRRARGYQINSPLMRSADAQALRMQLDDCEAKPVIFDPYAFAHTYETRFDPPPRRLAACVYGYLDGRSQWEERMFRGGEAWGRLGFAVEEAIG